eukprot:TRINITY_DN1818_c0_g1_i1.p2 TRINITY_DN1818_c0_g1~~TRINITY_DN1818_c0_g1_i1.p2  ORF type:complete len:101 (-),score=23.11 TRINITY_DN1818_c0_g1_i1:77-379(-)
MDVQKSDEWSTAPISQTIEPEVWRDLTKDINPVGVVTGGNRGQVFAPAKKIKKKPLSKKNKQRKAKAMLKAIAFSDKIEIRHSKEDNKLKRKGALKHEWD